MTILVTELSVTKNQ